MENHESLDALHQGVLVRLTTEDWPMWRSLRLQALRDAPYAFGSKLADWQGAGDMEERWRDRLSSVPFNLVARLDNQLVGMVSATELDKNATVDLISLWVAPSARGRGIGDALIEAVIQWASEQKASGVSLDVTEDNQRATKLYLRHGFVDYGKIVPLPLGEMPERRLLKTLSTASA